VFFSIFLVDKNDKRIVFREATNMHFVFELESCSRS
jgi:hypothetical protein